MIDLRSDTYTQPTEPMRHAMARADVAGEGHESDRATARLENEVALALGKPAALFTVTGTMGNALALLASGATGGGVLADYESHIVRREMSAPSPISQLTPFLVNAPGGALDLERVERWLENRAAHGRGMSLICTENTHTWRGGAVVDLSHLQALRQLAQRFRARVHLDGARLFNACVVTGAPLATLAATADTVMVNLCKGLGAPAGAILAGPIRTIERARQLRTALGGTLRKSGFYAAAALVALHSEWTGTIRRDHERASKVSGALSESEWWHGATQGSQSNIVHIDAAHLGLSGAELIANLRSHGVLASGLGPNTVRLVTHRDLGDDDVNETIAACGRVATQLRVNIPSEQPT